MLGARHNVGANVWRIADVGAAERIGQAERLASFPHLERGCDVEQPRTGVRGVAPVEEASRSLSQRIGLARIGEGEIVGRIEMIGLLAPRAHGLAEPNVQRHQAAADMREGAVENTPARLVPIESERNETADHPSALRAALDSGEIVGSIDRVDGAGVVLVGIAQEGAEVARRRKSEAADRRILGAVDQLIETPRFETVVIADMLLIRASRPRPARMFRSSRQRSESAPSDPARASAP